MHYTSSQLQYDGYTGLAEEISNVTLTPAEYDSLTEQLYIITEN